MFVCSGSRFRINRMVTSGTFIAQFFEEQGAAQAVYTNQTSHVVERKSSSGDIRVSGGVTYTDLAYEWADSDYKWDQVRDIQRSFLLKHTGNKENVYKRYDSMRSTCNPPPSYYKDRELKDKEPFFATGQYFDDTQENLKQVVTRGIAAQKTILENLDKSNSNIQNAHKFVALITHPLAPPITPAFILKQGGH